MQAVHVLIIDDEMEFTSILTDRLQSWGITASAAHGQEETLISLSQSIPDVAVLMLKGKGGYGLDLLGMIKECDPTLPVILLIDKGAALAGMLGMERGAADCLALPLDLGVLIEKIRQTAGIPDHLVDQAGPG